MARPTKDPEGPAEHLTLRLRPGVMRRLLEISSARGLSRAEVVEDLILGYARGSANPPPAGDPGCKHPKNRVQVLSTGLARCDACGALRNMHGMWSGGR